MAKRRIASAAKRTKVLIKDGKIIFKTSDNVQRCRSVSAIRRRRDRIKSVIAGVCFSKTSIAFAGIYCLSVIPGCPQGESSLY